jgi:probable F420-dependent oxidoreductase
VTDGVRIGLELNGQGISLADMIEFGVAAEAAGLDSVWTVENQRDPWVPLSVIASRTRSIRVGTGLAVWARSPSLMEMTAGNLDELSRGRFVLGIGTAPASYNEGWHGIPYRRPAARMREYVEIVRRMLAAHRGESVEFDGEFFHVHGYHRQVPPLRDRIPIYLGAVRRNMVELTGEIADGVLFNVLTTPRYLRDYALGFLEVGARRAGRSAGDLERGSVVLCAVSEDAAHARQMARHQIAYYAQIPYFDAILDLHGFQRETAALREAAGRGDDAGAIAAVTDDMVDALALAGSPDECRARLARFEGLLDLVLVFSPAFRLAEDEIRENHRQLIETFGR